MNLLAIRRNKCDLSKMIKMVHKRSTWGKKYIYATNDKHEVYIEISNLNFKKGIIYFRVFYETIYNTYQSIREMEVKYHMGKTDDSIEKLERRINNSILNDLNSSLCDDVEDIAIETDEYISLVEQQDENEENYKERVEEECFDDENMEVIIEALVEKYTDNYWLERRHFKDDYIAEHKNNHKNVLHKQYEEILKNDTSDDTSEQSSEGLPF